MHPRYDAIVIGAGIAGTCAALALQGGGARTALLDPATPGSGASFGNAGIVVNPQLTPVFAGLTPRALAGMLRDPASPLSIRLTRLPALAPWLMRMLRHVGADDVLRITRSLAELSRAGRRAWDRLEQEAGLADLLRSGGSLALHPSRASRDAAWDGPLVRLRGVGAEMVRLDRDGIDDLAPCVSGAYAHAVYSPGYRHTIDPQGTVARIADLFRARGGSFLREAAEGIEIDGRLVRGVRTSAGLRRAPVVVLAGGTSSADLAAAAGERVPHQAVGGYHAVLPEPGIALETPLLPMDFRVAITPMGGRIRIAGIYEFGGERLPPRAAIVPRLLAHAAAVLPGLDTSGARTWRGFRSYLPDGLPVLGPSGRTQGLHYLFGLSSAGMITGPGAALAVAAAALGEAPRLDLSPFAAARFTKGRP